MLKSIVFLASVLVAVAALPAVAADLKIGVVDMQKILQVAPQVLQVREQLRKEFAPQQKEILDKQRRLQALEEKFTKNGTLMSDDERETTQGRITQLQHEIQQSRNDFLDDLNLRRNEELGKLQRLVLKEVNDYAGENHFDLIVGDGVFYASKRVDVTEAIIQRLKQDFKKSGEGGQKK